MEKNAIVTEIFLLKQSCKGFLLLGKTKTLKTQWIEIQDFLRNPIFFKISKTILKSKKNHIESDKNKRNLKKTVRVKLFKK
jgi:hypothetical protein